MKFLKYVFFLILIVVIVGAVYFGAQDGKYNATASRNMEVPAPVVYDFVNDYNTWKDWGPWMSLDPNLKMTMGDTVVGIGASSNWESDIAEVGDGAMKTVSVVANKAIDQVITFKTPMGDSSSDVYWTFEPEENGKTKVTWGMKGEFSLLEKVFMAFSSEPMEENIETMYSQGLENLENLATKSMQEFTVIFDGISEYGGGYYMYTSAATTQAGLGAKMAPMMGKVAGYMQTNQIASSGMPFTIYNQVDTNAGTMIISTAIPVKERIITTDNSDVLCGYLPPLDAVKVTLKGNYSNLDKAYERGLAYIQEKGLTIHPEHPMFEIYANDPGFIPNPSNWQTEVYIPIEKPTETIN